MSTTSDASVLAAPHAVRPRYGKLHPRRAVGRLVLSTAVGLLVPLFISTGAGWPLRVVSGWDAAAVTLIGLIWSLMLSTDAHTTRCRAASADPGRTASWFLVLLASTISFFAAAVVMRHARVLAPHGVGILVALCLVAVTTAWALTHTAFTLRYAHLYYRDDDEGEGGLCFPGIPERRPDDFDFAYFAFTIGMCFQVSDVTITSPQIRRTVLAHALLSFAYNTVILALALNLLFGFLA